MMRLAGVVKGSVVAIIANNRREWVIAAYASFALGARYVPMYAPSLLFAPFFMSHFPAILSCNSLNMYEAMKSDDWIYILNDCKASLLFAAKIVPAKSPDLKRHDPSLQSIILLDAPAKHPDSFVSALARGRGCCCI